MSRLRAFFTGLIALALGGAAYLVGVTSVLGQRAEDSLLDTTNFNANPPAPLGLISTPLVIGVLLACAVLAVFVHGFGRSLSILLFGSLGVLGSQFLKHEWLLRPDLLDLEAKNTFPSGHMTVIGVLAAAAIWAVPKGLRAITTLVTSIIVATVAWQLLEFGWHRPSDIIGALALVVLVFAVASWLGPRGSRSSRRGQSVALGAINKVLNVILVVSGILLFVGGLLLMLVSSWVASDALLLAGAEVVLIGVSCLAVRTVARLCP